MTRSFALLALLSLPLPACRESGAPKEPAAPAPSAAATGKPEAAPSDGGAKFTWPVPEGWKDETIPFPLEFAPDLPYQGVEELRFAPAFFDPDAPAYFSYAFVWWLTGRPELDGPSLERALTRYFAGLCDAVGGKSFSFDPKRFKTKLEASAEPVSVTFPVSRSFRGTVDAYDPFKKGNGREITLNVELAAGDCAGAGRRVLFVAASPKPRTDPVWKALAERAAAFRCP